MKVTKHYEHDHVILNVEYGGQMRLCITLDSDEEMRRLGECLLDLSLNTGYREVTIEPNK